MIQNNKKSVFVLGFIFLFMLKSNAQDFDLAGISSVTYPKSGIKGSNQKAEFSFQEFGALVNIPYKFKNGKTILVNGVGYAWIESSGAELSFFDSDKNKEQLHAIYYQLMLVHKMKNNWRLLVSLRPTIASDFDEALSTNDFVMQGVGFAMKQVNEKFSIGGGLAYTMRFGKPFAFLYYLCNIKRGSTVFQLCFL